MSNNNVVILWLFYKCYRKVVVDENGRIEPTGLGWMVIKLDGTGLGLLNIFVDSYIFLGIKYLSGNLIIQLLKPL